MTNYMIRRVFLALPTFLGVLLVVFLAVRLLPGDAVAQMLDGSWAAEDPEVRANLEQKYNLDSNVLSQFVEWIGELGRGDLGRSIVSGRAVTGDLRTRLPATMELGVIGLLVTVTLAIPVGLVSAINQDRLVDHVARSVAILLLAIPSFWLGMLVIIYGFAWFGWTPPLRYHQFWEDPVANLTQVAVPGVILGAYLSGTLMRITRSAMLEVLRQDFVRTARAKGLARRHVVIRHALRNALIPIITVIGVQIPIIVGGTVVLERIFSIPGMGNYLLTSVLARDYPVIQAIVILSATVVIVGNVVVDFIYPAIDPRITLS